MKTNTPPKLFLNFFRWYCHPKLRGHIEGDLMELYNERVKEFGKRKADRKFIVDVLLLFRPGIIRPERNQNINTYAMYKNYFKIGWRNLIKNKGYSLINIGGLALGMAVAMVIGLWVFDELSFNTYHQNYERIAQVMKGAQFEGKHYEGQKSLPYPLISELKNNYGANFKHIVPASWGGDAALSIHDKKISKVGMFIGEDAPEMLTFRMTCGTWKGLKDINSIMISQSTAEALFGSTDPINQMVKINDEKEATVTGVYEDFPKNTEFHGIQFFRPWEFLVNDSNWMRQQGWDNHFLQIYVEIQPYSTFESTTANIINAETKAIQDLAYMKDELKYNNEILLLPMSNWHLRADFKEGVLQSGPVQLVWFIGLIGVFVLLLACINFMNLSTARSEKRAKEVGIRKTFGSIRRQLIGQFFSESFLVVMFAFLLSFAFVYFSLPWFNDLSGKEMSMPWTQLWFWLSCFVFLLTTGLLAGSYPALYLSSFKPVSVLKGVFRVGRFASVPRRVLVTVQFTVSVMLIICTGVIYHQLMFVKNRPVGYERKGLLMIPKKSDAFNKKAEALKAELKNSGAVTEIAESVGTVTTVWSNNGGFSSNGKDLDNERNYATLGVSHDFGKVVGWQFVEGRDFSKEIASDSSGFVINEAAAKFMRINNPVGQIIHWKNGPWRVDRDFVILGVIKDMVMGSPFEPVKPTIYFTMGRKNWLMLRVTAGMPLQEALSKIEKVFANVIPNLPFDYKFANAEYAAKFSTEDRIGKLASVFSILAIVISCLGLFGLASFVAEQRTKEIGVRKVLGASVANLWLMLSKEFVILVILACLIAIPLSYYLLYNGIKQYEYKTEIGWWIFAASAVGALIITLLTVSYQSIKTALTNPVKSLRSE